MTLLASRRSRPVGPLYRGSCLSILRYYLVLCLSSLALASRWTVNNGPNDKIRGVNLGGHLVLECWLTPSICAVPFESKLTTNVSQVRDEWTLCSLLGKVQCQALLEEHWRTYYSESDFVQIKAYGLNTVRIPIGYWALTPLHYDEPYVAGQIPYLQQLLKWADGHQLDVVLDLHGAPGSQNGYDNSGRLGPIEWSANTTNVDITVAALQSLSQIAVDPQFHGVVKAVELLNEPFTLNSALNLSFVQDFYFRGQAAVQAVFQAHPSSYQLPVILYQSAFQTDRATWSNFFGSHNILNPIVDEHTYFVRQWSNMLAATDMDILSAVCATLARQQFGIGIVTQEFSLATEIPCAEWSDCINQTVSSQANFSIAERIYRRQLWEAQTAIYEHGNSMGWIFWTWRTAASPLWDYRAAVALGFIPANLTERHYPFNPASATSCLDISTPYTPALPPLPSRALSDGLLTGAIQGWNQDYSAARIKQPSCVLLSILGALVVFESGS